MDTLPSNGEWQRYRDNDNHRLEGDVLRLVAHVRNGLTNGGIESGLLRSKKTFKHGYIEARMKVPAGRGMWPCFWLVPAGGGWPPEIDIVEIVNNGRDTTRVSYHYLHPATNQSITTVSSKLNQWNGYSPGFDFKDNFHVFAVEWTQDTVKHFVDDVMVAERRFPWKQGDGNDGGDAIVLLNLAVGGGWPGNPTSVSDFPAMLDVDYIRIWQK